MQHLLSYLKSSPDKLSDDALTSTITFAVDKIGDKRFEEQLFAILDAVAAAQSTQFLFTNLYPQLAMKNPVLPARVLTFFAFHLGEVGSSSDLNFEEFANQIRPLFTHGDGAVRKAANDCANAVSTGNPEAAAKFFKKSEAKEKPVEEPKPKGKSEIPVPSARQRSASPGAKGASPATRPPSAPPKPSPAKEKTFFPSKLVQKIAKTQSVLDTRKALEEAEGLLTRHIDQFGPSSLPSTEFTELFSRLRQWFQESNTNVILSVTKVIGLCFKAIIDVQITSVSVDFLHDVCLLLNFSHKGIRSGALAALQQLEAIHPQFVPIVFLPSFWKLNVEGKRAGVTFLRTLEFDMTVEQYCPLIVSFLADKSESFRELARP
jgi:hypothetical protein